MKTFEISKTKSKNGRRKFKAVLYEIFPDSCVDEENQVGTKFNRNGITWIKEYCEKALPSIKGMSLRCEFADEERTELLGHGETGIVNDEPVFEDAVVIGTFSKGYIEEVESEKGTILACIGEGSIDSQCYHNLVEKLDKDAAQGIYPKGSIEIMKTEDNDSIIYKYGYKDEGRIPMEFIHSGYALLGVLPADDMAMLIELNKSNKEDLHKMEFNKDEITALISKVVDEMSSHNSEINECKKECEEKVAKANEDLENAVNEKNEIEAASEKIQAALDACKAEFDALNKKYDELWQEKKVLEEALAEAKAKERIGEMNAAIANFSDEEKKYAQTEIDAFNENPITSEINTVVNKIWEGIGKTAKANAEKVAAETNAAKNDIIDIFGEVDAAVTSDEDVDIF